MRAHAVYGSPGTGKTTELLNRVSALRRNGVDPNSIGFMSHTRAAASEALSRLGLTSSDKVSTIHSMCFRALGLERAMVVDKKRLRMLTDQLGVPIGGGSIDDEQLVEIGDEYLAIHGLATVARQPLRDVFDQYRCSGTWQQCEWFIKHYEVWKKRYGLVDFNDMLVHYNNTPIANGTRVLLVDEAQDLSSLQWLVIRNFIKTGITEVHIAGDDDQCVYKWGGADATGMQQFEDDYKATRTVLPQSFRIPRVVHELAEHIIQRVKGRVLKTYQPRPELGSLTEYGDLHQLAPFDARSTMVLMRTGARRKEIERHLQREAVPYLTEGGRPGPFQSRLARAFRAMVHLRRAGEITDSELKMLIATAHAHVKPLLLDRQLARVAKMRDEDVINAMYGWYEYYSRVDLAVTPTVRVMTIHASKGHEADRVVLDTSLTQRVADGVVTDPDSEARVYFVGITRTRHELNIVHGVNGYDMR